jgi:beta-glucosidase
VGINYYSRFPCRWALLPPGLNAREAAVPGRPRSAMWEVCPEGLHGMLARLRTEYGNPAVVITENGYPLPEEDAVDPWDDRDRICYLADHLAALSRAGREGSDVRGYFHWSLVDNFEWNLGLRMRFGLVRVDFATQERTPRRSAAWFAEAARTNAVPPVPAPLGP